MKMSSPGESLVSMATEMRPFTLIIRIFDNLILFIFLLQGVHSSPTDPEGPMFVSEPPSRVHFANSTGTRIDCTARGWPSPWIEWTTLDGSVAKDIPRLRRIFQNGTLEFFPFRADEYRADVHSVTYLCRVGNPSGVVVSGQMQVRAVVLQSYEVQVYDEYVIRGNTAVMRCHIPSFVKDYVIVVSWVEEPSTGQPAKSIETRGRYLITSTGELHINHVTTSDNNNTYRCRTKHQLTGEIRLSAISPSGRLYVTEPRGSVPPRITDHRSSVHAVQGESVLLPCAAQGFPVPTYSWFAKMNAIEVLPISSSSRIRQIGGTLVLTNALILDAGTYVCEVTNSMGSVRIETSLSVSAPLSAYIYPPRQVVDVGQSATLTCVIAGYPFTQVTWLKDGKPLMTDTINHVTQEVLRLDTVHRRDRGMYQCFVNNYLQVVQGSAEVALGDTFPEFQRTFADKVVHQGSLVSLECVVSGSPLPQITWTLDNVRVYEEKDKITSTNYVDINGDVISVVNISNVQVQDGGQYSCLASNQAGQVEHVAKLSVRGPPFIRLDDVVTAVAGTDLVVRCYVTGYPIDSIHWERDHRVLPVNLRQKIFPNGTLLVQNVQKALDEGRYTCVARAGVQSERRDTNVSVMASPKIIPFSFQDEHLREGARARIQCVVSEGDLPIAITWIKDGRTVSDHRDIVIRDLDDFSSMLTVNSVSSRHNGNYTCLATNKAGPTNYTTELLVNVPPKILPFTFRDAQLQEGMRAQITCAISEGDEPVKMEWLKDGHSLSPALGISIREFDRHTSSLSIERVTSNHGGNYTCTATNRAAQVHHTALLLVNVPPRWVTQPKDADVLLDGNILLPCQADGFPKPTVTWMKAIGDAPGDYREIAFGLTHLSLHDDGSLEFTGAHESDKGYYLCKANNGIGAGLSEVVYLNVRVPAYFQTNTRNLTVKVGGHAELVCEAYGDKPLTVTWSALKDPSRVEDIPRYNVNENYWEKGTLSELVIENIQRNDSGDYPCIATNAYGTDQAHVHLTVQEPPEHPTELRTSEVSSRNFHLSWTAPFDGHAPISLYIIQYKDKSKSWQEDSRNLTVSGYTTVYQLDRLQPATGYNVRIYAKNEIGTSKASEQVDVFTEMEAPGGPPQQIRVVAVDSTSLIVYWKPPRSDLWHGRITGYKIGFRQHENSKNEFEFRTARIEELEEKNLSEMSYQLIHLKKYTKYSIVMIAFNHLGDGPVSEQVLARTAEDVPSRPPQDVQCVPISSQGLSISWEPPSALFIHGQLQGYKVLYKPIGSWFDDTPAEVKISQTWKTTLHGLEKFQKYVIFVLAFTRVGDGVRSEPVFCLTKEDVPDAPESLKALVSSIDSIVVVWRLPIRCNGIIIRFTIYVRSFDAGKDEISKYTINNNHTLSYEMRNLRKNHRYEYWATASTSVGEGQSTKPVSQTPSSRVPARIVAFDQVVRYRWQDNATLNCHSVGLPPPITDWKLDGKPFRSTERFQVSPSGSLFIAHLLSSDAGIYTCRVQNIHGSDAVAYTLIVEGPPEAPQLTVVSSTFTSIDIQWQTPSDGGSPIEGYIIYLKRDFGEWEFVQLQFQKERHSLEGLWCGTRYQLYMLAWNKIGSGEASETKSTRTQGSAPIMPVKSKLVQENSTFLALNLDSWENGGCPILYFVVEYRPIDQQDWLLVSNNVKVQKEKFMILDLESKTKYALRVTAHNSAGSTVAEYEFLTRPIGEDDELEITLQDTATPFYLEMNFTFSLAAILILICAATFSILFWKKHKVRSPRDSADGTNLEAKQYEARYTVGGDKKMSIIQSDFDKGSFTCLLVNSEGGSEVTPSVTPRNQKRVAPRGEIQPYATYQLPGCKTDGFTAEDWKKYEIYNPVQQTVRVLQVGSGSVYPQLKKETGEFLHGQESSLSDDQEYASPVRSSDTSDSTSGNNQHPEPELGLRLSRHPTRPRKPGRRAKVPDLIYRRHGECTKLRSPISPVLFPSDIAGHTILKIPRPQLERPTAPAPDATIETTFSFLDNIGSSSQESREDNKNNQPQSNSTNSLT